MLLRSVTGRKACRQAGAHLDAARRRRRLGPRPQGVGRAHPRLRLGRVEAPWREARAAVAAPPEWRLGSGPTRMGPAPRPTPPKRCAFKARCASGGAGEHLTRLGVRPGSRLRSLAQSPSRRRVERLTRVLRLRPGPTRAAAARSGTGSARLRPPTSSETAGARRRLQRPAPRAEAADRDGPWRTVTRGA